MLKDLNLLFKIIIKFFKFEFFFTQIIIVINSLLQVLTILSFGPLILLLTGQESMNKLNLKFLNFIEPENLLFYLTVIASLLFVTSNLSNILVSKITLNLGQKIGIYLNKHIFIELLNKDYNYHVNTNSSEIISKITLETARVVSSIIIPLLIINSRLIVIFSIFIGILFVDTKVTLIVSIFLITNYLIIFYLQKKRLILNSNTISLNNKLRQKIISETFNNMRETIIFNTKKYFLKLFNITNQNIGLSIANNQFLSSLPRNIIEIILFLSIISMVLFLKIEGKLIEYLPLIGIYLVAAYKLLPAIQSLASSFASIRGNFSALQSILPEIYNLKNKTIRKIKGEKSININFKSLKIKNVDFSYDNKIIFKKANFHIIKNQTIGIFGKTGVGKSTLIDLICGLIRPKNGEYILNGKKLSKKFNSNIINLLTIVPQRINLLDASVKDNIVFTQKYKNENELLDKLENLKHICKLDFIDKKTKGWNLRVGENGTKLSGGQIQRIGLARALYRSPKILILDEATSGIDRYTEEIILKNIKEKLKITIIIISHNKRIFKFCDNLYELKNYSLKKVR